MSETDRVQPDDKSPCEPAGPTSIHVRQARTGNSESIEWIVKRFSPLLLASARHHLRGVLKTLYEPEDLVQEVWLTVIPKLTELPERAGRYTPAFLKFLSSILVNKIGNLLQKHVLGKARGRHQAARGAEGERKKSTEGAADPHTSIVQRLLRAELRDAVREALERLEEDTRAVVVLRGIEGNSYKEIAAILDVDSGVLPMRYRRGLEKLRKELPGSVIEELVEE